jgi:hypothetical protein
MKQGSPRPNNGAKCKNGKFVVPVEIRALKPENPPCTVKTSRNGYYVVERLRVPDPNHPGKMKNASGKTIGHIIDGKYVPLEDQIKDISDEVPDILNYGAYAVALACSKDVLSRLKTVFSQKDSINIYVIAVIYAVNHYIPARDLHEMYIQSVLCQSYPEATLSENVAGKFIENLGRHNKKRRQFEQGLIDDGSGCYNIDGHVMLCVSNNNELADYGAKYESIGNMQANFMMVFDAKLKRAISCDAFEGGIPDKQAVKDTFAVHHFNKARFRIDSGFYSEDNFQLYRSNECIFIIPVPATTILRKTVMRHLTFSKSFVHKRKDKHGKMVCSSIQYEEYTVSAIEDVAVQDAKDEAEAKKKELEQQAKSGEKIRKVNPRKVERSKYPDDRIIVYKDQLMYNKLYFDYSCLIGDGNHTEEKLAELEKGFGVILLRTNDPAITAENLYIEYKDRWPIETYYNYVNNIADFKALHEENYFTQQGVGFLIVVESLIRSEMAKLIQNATMPFVHNMSIDECIRVAGRLKVVQNSDNTWNSNTMKGKIVNMFEYMGVDVQKDIKRLNSMTQ